MDYNSRKRKRYRKWIHHEIFKSKRSYRTVQQIRIHKGYDHGRCY